MDQASLSLNRTQLERLITDELSKKKFPKTPKELVRERYNVRSFEKMNLRQLEDFLSYVRAYPS